jgi:hypothetical protein
MARAENVIRLKNNSTAIQSVFVDSIRHDIYPHTVKSVNEEVASVFLNERSQYVSVFREVEVPHIFGERIIWVANASGNPFAPKTITLKRKHKGEDIEYEAPNPLSIPTVVRERSLGNQILTDTPDGTDKMFKWDRPPFVIELPPFYRMGMSERYARWLVNRDAMREEQHVGKVVFCREPGEFEPNESWPIHHLQVWGINAIPSEVWDQAPEVKEILHAKPEDFGSEDEVFNARQKLWEAIFFILIDDTYHVPTRYDFNNWLKAAEKRAGKKPKPADSDGASATA